MRFSLLTIAAVAGLVAAAPTDIEKRQATQNDLKSGQCKKVTLIFARASTEPGNMGMSMGPAVCSGLKTKLGAGNVACQGVGGAYSAGLPENALPAGTTPGAITEAQNMFKMADSKCPNTIIVAGGYSQGTAVMMNAVKGLPANIKQKVRGVVLFGYTKNGQTKSSIPEYPKNQVLVLCSASDGVCGGALLVTPGHFSYMADGSGPKAINFLVSAINSAGGSSSSGGESSSPAPAKSPKGKGFGGMKGSGGAVTPPPAVESAPAAESAPAESAPVESAPAEAPAGGHGHGGMEGMEGM